MQMATAPIGSSDSSSWPYKYYLPIGHCCMSPVYELIIINFKALHAQPCHISRYEPPMKYSMCLLEKMMRINTKWQQKNTVYLTQPKLSFLDPCPSIQKIQGHQRDSWCHQGTALEKPRASSPSFFMITSKSCNFCRIRALSAIQHENWQLKLSNVNVTNSRTYQARWIQQLILYHFVAAWMETLWENQCICDDYHPPSNLGCEHNKAPATSRPLRSRFSPVRCLWNQNNKQFTVRSDNKTSAKSKAQNSSLFVFQVSKALPFQVSLQDQLLVQEDHQRKHPWPIVSPQLPSTKLDSMEPLMNLKCKALTA